MLNLFRSFLCIFQTLLVAFMLLTGAGGFPASANLPSPSAAPPSSVGGLLFDITVRVGTGGEGDNVSSASGIASSGFKHNYLKHEETDAALALLKKLERCRAILSPCSDEEKAEVLKDYEHYKNLSLKNTFAMLATCKAGNKTECAAMLKEAHLFNQRVTAHEMIGKIPGAQDFYISSGDHFGLDTLTSLDAIAVSEYSKAVSGAISFEEASENLYSSALASESERKLLFGAVQIIGAVGASALCPLSAGATCYGALALASANVALGANEASEGVTQLLTNKDHRSAIERALIEEFGFSEAKAERYLNNAHLLVGMFDLIAGGAGVVKLIRKPKPGISNPQGQQQAKKPEGTNGGPRITIREHYAHHKAMTDDLKAQLNSQGYRVSDREISFGSSCGTGRCRPDIVYETPDGKLGIIEVKTGNADLTIRQSQIYPQINSGDAIPRGQVARDFDLRPGVPLRDQGYPNGIPIEVRNFPGAGQ